ncbi:MAG: EI24 domain-containing protein [Shimia sp.]|uniref:EI24 domain-containing protein n=1 Tax=Shimia sp. TaxID=1954381 RepID=UPI001B232036|nr:EI24 domain-containing protein [Shimia sp.]MBO6897062.1 EI24 domain-containing protein [Shimia sp.]
MAVSLAITSFGKTLTQIGDPRFRRVLFKGIGLTFVLLIAVYTAFLMFLNWIGAGQTVQELLGNISWVGDLFTFASLFLMIALSIFLMIPVASAITSLFLDEVADAVEDKHYPELPDVPRVSFSEGLKDSVNFLGVLIAANILALVLYAIFPPFSLFIFWGLNGFLLGREYFQLVAMRRVGRAEAKKLRKKHMGTIWLAGTLMAMPLVVPLLNLVIPILGAATFTHLYHQLEPTPQRAPSR